MPRSELIALLLLTGCVTAPTTEEESPFGRPAGSSRSPHVGYVQPARPEDRLFTLALSAGHGLRVGDLVVSRDAALRATALLRVEQLQGRVALASLRRGRPQPKDEVVLPSSELSRAAEGLAPPPPGS